MPFIGKDWRSPGEQWVKTHKGFWERLKLLDNASKFLGFQSSDSSSLDSGSSISDNENCSTFMDSECSSSQRQHFEINLSDVLDEKPTEANELTDNILKENVFLLNSSNQSETESLKFNQQFSNNLDSATDKDVKMMNDDEESFREPMKRRTHNESKPEQKQNDFTITEFNSTIKGTKNTSIQYIISKYERNQKSFVDGIQRPNRLERQSSFDEIKINPKQPFLKSTKQRHLFPSKSIDQPMFDLEPNDQKSTNKFSSALNQIISRLMIGKIML